IAGADEAGGAVHVVDGAVRQADVVGDGVEFAFGNCAADSGFDLIAEFRGFLDAGSGLCAKVKDELAAVCAGEEILAQPGGEEEGWDEDAAVLDEALEQRLVRVAEIRESALETTLKPDEGIA